MKGWLGNVWTPDDLKAQIMSESPFPCHLTMEEREEDYSLCRGSVLFMKKAGKIPRDFEFGQIVKQCSHSETENILSVKEFLEHHKDSL